MTTSFRFPSKPSDTKLPASGTAPDSASVARSKKLPGDGTSNDVTARQQFASSGMLNVIGVPTEISDLPPAIRFGTLTVIIPHGLFGQVRGRDGSAFAVMAVFSGDAWQAQSCVAITVAPPYRPPVAPRQESMATEPARPLVEQVETASHQQPQRLEAMPELRNSPVQPAPRFGGTRLHPERAAGAPASSPVSFGRPATTHAGVRKNLPGEIGVLLDETDDIPY
ncbi:hypothetical protein K2O51_31885 (plasmid) [Cupriavidus pinatubonensis]|uniref:hypothetical protein n=1 Tax=Cupriavidus pinatubonensis TaxID=248026 RepID=UPI001C737C07|nr:hypothetical protein [Cupriavidus pinatubonensis]QYY33628.1 hypothetical protein K2O51_31885 [Cupriavidus pinatubonensis]